MVDNWPQEFSISISTPLMMGDSNIYFLLHILNNFSLWFELNKQMYIVSMMY